MPSKEPADGARSACSLSPAEWIERTESLGWLAGEARSVEERDDGFELVFPSEDQLVTGLFELVAAERRCCPFIRFELVFEPHLGPVRLSLRGPEELKSLLGPLLRTAESGD